MARNLRPDLLIASLLRPLARFCVKRGVRIQELEELARKALVEEARSTIGESGGETSVSKISVTTGIHRGEVARLLAGTRRPKEKYDVLNRVIGLWSQAKSLLNSDGSPRLLTHEGTESEFARLVSSVSKEVTHYPILFELERIGAIEYEGSKVKLKAAEYIPRGDVEHGLNVLGDDIESLVSTVEGNLSENLKAHHLHLRTTYDNIEANKIEEIRSHILTRGMAFQREMREYLSAFDRDINPSSAQGGKRAKVVVSTFSQACQIEEVKEIKPKKRGRKPCKAS